MFGICDDDEIIHFIGLGGVGMSGIAEILHSLGYTIKGSDIRHSQHIERLERLGITAFIGHDKTNVANADVVVYSSAIHPDNPELLRARELRIPCLTRAEMLSQIVRLKKSIVVSGSHGKTTVTSICASILEMAAFDPTVINGGVINSYKTNAKLGCGDWTVVESDESDGSFVQLFPTIGIITNIDNEHVNHYGSLSNLKNAFKSFFTNLPFYGTGIACIDDPNVAEIIGDIMDRNIVTYAIRENAMLRAINIRKDKDGSLFDVKLEDDILRDIYIPMLGDHNILNALSAIAMSRILKIEPDTVRKTLASFTGVNRRFTIIGSMGGITFVDDYAHHPTEIRVLINAAKQKTIHGKVVIVCQPHRFTRLNTLFNEFCTCFDGADVIILTPVYKADDSETSNITSKNLYEALNDVGKNVTLTDDQGDVEDVLCKLMNEGTLSSGDIILFAGAGNISRWGHDIYEKLMADRSERIL
ncbi:MAG: UDP-N-acetylmuramate--L-alanine ligase [Holosporales bacterium]|jgi:UDP-N-acetylmuramate--alanine ligase|nr:UDP-N-acetylmuramate--L-alanine ligase [Holosporales bacterium]